MCSSPHEMSTEQIEHYLQWMRQEVADGNSYWSWRIEHFEALLAERRGELVTAQELGDLEPAKQPVQEPDEEQAQEPTRVDETTVGAGFLG